MEQEELKREVKGIWIPIEIWERKDLSVNEKVLYAEIDSYTTKSKDCFMSDEYISAFLGVNKTNANKTLSSLIKKGLVVKTRFDGRKRYVRAALSQTTTLPCQQQQPSYIYSNNNCSSNSKESNTLPIQSTNKEEKENSKKESEYLFNNCWIAYCRKGSKKKSLEQWNKLKDTEKDLVLPHIKAYVSSRERQYQKDFERYLKDRTFNDVVLKGNVVYYDPSVSSSNEYHPQESFDLHYNDYYKCYMFTGMLFDYLADGYTDDNRPDGATIKLNNARGTMVWSSNDKKWNKEG